jgi:hypothetical protein
MNPLLISKYKERTEITFQSHIKSLQFYNNYKIFFY